MLTPLVENVTVKMMDISKFWTWFKYLNILLFLGCTLQTTDYGELHAEILNRSTPKAWIYSKMDK